MNPGADGLRQPQPDDINAATVPTHAGLDIAGALSRVPKGNAEVLIATMVAIVDDKRITLRSEVHDALLLGPEIVKIRLDGDRQRYFRELFMHCLANSDDGKCVFPTSQTVLNDKHLR